MPELGAAGARSASSPKYLADQLTLFQPGGKVDYKTKDFTRLTILPVLYYKDIFRLSVLRTNIWIKQVASYMTTAPYVTFSETICSHLLLFTSGNAAS